MSEFRRKKMPAYEAPKITELGSLEEMTLGSGTWHKSGSTPDIISADVGENGNVTFTTSS